MYAFIFVPCPTEEPTFMLIWVLLLKMKQEPFRSPSYTVECEDYVHVVEFNPFDSGTAESLIAYGGNNYVVIGRCSFQVSLLQLLHCYKET